MFILGIDTSGTYTDGVLLDRESHHVLCTAKALTTPHDLAIGIGMCMQALQFHRWQDIAMVSLSTTLATNTIVEGKGCRAGLLLLGKKPAGKLPADVCAMVDAQMDIRGNILQRLAPASLHQALQHLRGRCDAAAISGYASVRNPAHECQAAQAVRESLGIPVVCGHELTGALGFYERTVTAVLSLV